MKNILSTLLDRLGIKGPENLTTEELTVYNQYRAILSKEELTLEDIKTFCQAQVELIEAKWRDYGFQNKAELIPYHTVYKTLLVVLDSPKVARETLERQLNEMIKNIKRE